MWDSRRIRLLSACVIVLWALAQNSTPLAEAPGELVIADPVAGNLRYVPAGAFTQGSPESEPCRGGGETQFVHSLSRGLLVMETEVTRQMWAALKAVQPDLPDDPTDLSAGAGPDHPVQNVNWHEMLLFANLLSVERGLAACYYLDEGFTTLLTANNYLTSPVYCDWLADGFRLPSEGEWEYACRAGSTGAFSVEEPNYGLGTCQTGTPEPALAALDSVAWWLGNAGWGTHLAGTKAANPWNLRDVHGNVWELCWDWSETYPAGTQADYYGPETGVFRVARGNGWYAYAADYCRSAARGYFFPTERGFHVGFRLVRTWCTPPAIVTPPDSISIQPSGNGVLEVQATGDNLHFQWYQGLTGDTGTPVGTDSASYDTGPLTETTSFWVRVENECGLADSPAATVAILCPAPATPGLTVPAEADSGAEYGVSWSGASTGMVCEIQEADNPLFSNATVSFTLSASQAFQHVVGQPAFFYYRVRLRETCDGDEYISGWSGVAHVCVGCAATTPGDADGSGVLDILDALWLADYLAGNLEVLQPSDLDGDGAITPADLHLLLLLLSGDLKAGPPPSF